MNTTTEIRRLYLWSELYQDFCRDSLVQFGAKTTTEIRRLYLWSELYQDFCRDSLESRQGSFGGQLDMRHLMLDATLEFRL